MCLVSVASDGRADKKTAAKVELPAISADGATLALPGRTWTNIGHTTEVHFVPIGAERGEVFVVERYTGCDVPEYDLDCSDEVNAADTQPRLDLRLAEGKFEPIEWKQMSEGEVTVGGVSFRAATPEDSSTITVTATANGKQIGQGFRGDEDGWMKNVAGVCVVRTASTSLAYVGIDVGFDAGQREWMVVPLAAEKADDKAATKATKATTKAATKAAISLKFDEYYHSYDAPSLPAISADGKWVAFIDELRDGPNGNVSNLQVSDARTGALVDQLDLDGTVEETLAGSPDPTKLRKRVDAANAYLARHTWTPMLKAYEGSTDLAETKVSVDFPSKDGHPFVLGYDYPKLRITSAGSTLNQTVGSEWSRNNVYGHGVPAELAGVYYAPNTGAVLIELWWPGTHEDFLGNMFTIVNTSAKPATAKPATAKPASDDALRAVVKAYCDDNPNNAHCEYGALFVSDDVKDVDECGVMVESKGASAAKLDAYCPCGGLMAELSSTNGAWRVDSLEYYPGGC